MYRLNIYMSNTNKPKTTEETSIELITALVERDRELYGVDELQWVRVAGRLAAMIAEWSRNDYTIRSELMSIQERRVKKKIETLS
jgi:hypothetical protein